MTAFSGFPSEGIAFLRDLPSRDTAWFKANRPAYQELLAEPAKAFVEAMGERLRERISPEIVSVAKANGSIAPINNDVRFAKEKAAYKDHLLFRFWEGEPKQTAPTLFVRLSPDSVGFASGAVFRSVDTWRARVDDDATGKPLARAVHALAKKKKADVAGAELKRAPIKNTERAAGDMGLHCASVR